MAIPNGVSNGAAPEIVIEMSDLEELAHINPLAWEQLLHIADNRILRARIVALENGGDTHDLAHG